MLKSLAIKLNKCFICYLHMVTLWVLVTCAHLHVTLLLKTYQVDVTVTVCESLRQLTSSKTEWIWNATYHKLFGKAKLIITEDMCMKFYNETQLLCLETDVSGIRLGAELLQTEVVQAAQQKKNQTKAYSEPSIFQARACQV